MALLFRIDEVPEGAARGFTIRDVAEPDRPPRGLVAVRRGGSLHVYVNRCPHRGTPLDWAPDDFLDAEGTHLVCATHGALFRIHDGVCIAGPCAGDELEAFPVELRDDGSVHGPEGVVCDPR